MTKIATMILAAAIALAAVGCGGGGTTASGVEGSQQVSAISPTDQASLCDWFAGLAGGYGTDSACEMGFLSAPPSQADCLADFPDCAVTVTTLETCMRAVVSAQQTCTEQSLTAAQATPECAAVGAAHCFN